jgi:hypothetical protein
MIVRRGRQSGVAVHPHRFRHHFSHTWLDRGGAEGDLMELNGWTSPQMLRRYGASARGTEPAAATTASWTPPPDTRAASPQTPAQRPRKPRGTSPYGNRRALMPARHTSQELTSVVDGVRKARHGRGTAIKAAPVLRLTHMPNRVCSDSSHSARLMLSFA